MSQRHDPHTSGVLLVNKPEGPTSFGVVAQARGVYGTRSIGHAGTLDPMATGVLVLLVGEATKLCNYLTSASKRYLATVTFGLSTDSLDRTGVPDDQVELRPGWLQPAALELALAQEKNRISQAPPAYSAIKVNGRRAYALAREGKTVHPKPRNVSVHGLSLRALSDTSVRVELNVSKGYYVRAFARDLGERLGVPSHLSSLERTASGAFELRDCHAWPPLAGARPPLIATADAARSALPAVTLTSEGETLARHGKRLDDASFEQRPESQSTHAWFGKNGTLVALGRWDADAYRVVRGFSDRLQSTATSTS